MKRLEVEHPAPATERMARWSEIEEAIVALQELGWSMEKYSQVDEEGEPLRFYLRMSYKTPSSLPEIL